VSEGRKANRGQRIANCRLTIAGFSIGNQKSAINSDLTWLGYRKQEKHSAATQRCLYCYSPNLSNTPAK